MYSVLGHGGGSFTGRARRIWLHPVYLTRGIAVVSRWSFGKVQNRQLTQTDLGPFILSITRVPSLAFEGGRDDDELAHQFRMPYGWLQGDTPAKRVAHDVGLLNTKMLDQRGDAIRIQMTIAPQVIFCYSQIIGNRWLNRFHG